MNQNMQNQPFFAEPAYDWSNNRRPERAVPIPFVQVHSEDALMKRLYAEDPRRPVGDEHYRFVAPVGVEIDKQFGPNSNMTISYAYHGLGRAEAFHLNVFGIGFTCFW
jgi:hypothetical protein